MEIEVEGEKVVQACDSKISKREVYESGDYWIKVKNSEELIIN